MLQLSSGPMHNMGKSNRGPRGGRNNAMSRGGIRKRGAPTRIDRDGDLDMDGGSGRGRGAKRARGDSGRTGSSRRMVVDRDRTLDTIHKALASNPNSQANIKQVGSKIGGLEQVSVRGWKQSKAASNSDGGRQSLLIFLEKKLAPPDTKAATSNTRNNIITKSRVDGDALIVSIRPEHLDRMLQINGFSFAGAPLIIEQQHSSTQFHQPTEITPSTTTADTKAKMRAFLSSRYLKDTKLLNLSNLASDPILIEMGLFTSSTTDSKFFPALMRVWETNFESPQMSREAVQSISLANNNLSSLQHVTSISQSFPGLKNMDLSNNSFPDEKALNQWRWKFRQLEFLDLSGSPFSTTPTFKDTVLKWYPKLKVLNNTQVRTDEELAVLGRNPMPPQPAHFKDESRIAETFIRAFFTGFDTDRTGLVYSYYDKNSTFSMNVNVAAPRGAQETATASWDSYIKKSRNLLKINHLPARGVRAFIGVDKIRDLWTSLPETRHPSMVAHPEEWLIECHALPGIPSPTGDTKQAVGGLLIMVHSKFDELAGSNVVTRSFDRTFVLGPGDGPGGVRVISDLVTLRSYGGHIAWDIDSQMTSPTSPTTVPPPQSIQPAQPAPPAQQVHPQAPHGYGMPAPGKTDSQVQQEQMVLHLSFTTKMTLQYSEMALSGNGWNMDVALKNFQELTAQGKLPQDAFIPGV